MSHLSRKKPEKYYFKNCVGGNCFEIFLRFPEVYSSLCVDWAIVCLILLCRSLKTSVSFKNKTRLEKKLLKASPIGHYKNMTQIVTFSGPSNICKCGSCRMFSSFIWRGFITLDFSATKFVSWFTFQRVVSTCLLMFSVRVQEKPDIICSACQIIWEGSVGDITLPIFFTRLPEGGSISMIAG